MTDLPTLISDALDAWSSNPPHQYRTGGQWFQDGPQLPSYTQGGPATGAAVVWRARGEDRHRQIALQSIGFMLNTQAKDGSFVDGISTQFFLQELGTTYLLLQSDPRFVNEQAAWWQQCITKAADYLINAGHTNWYANGNINAGYTYGLYLAARITGQVRFRDAYERSLSFMQNPTAPKWAAEGLQLSVQPTKSDGSDGNGYLTESSGFDTEYTGVQLDVLVRHYLLTLDSRIKRLMTLLGNSVTARVNPMGMLLDTSGGSRHPQLGRTVPFNSPYYYVAAPDMYAFQLGFIDASYRSAFKQSNPNFYRGLGAQLAVPLLPQFITPAP